MWTLLATPDGVLGRCELDGAIGIIGDASPSGVGMADAEDGNGATDPSASGAAFCCRLITCKYLREV